MEQVGTLFGNFTQALISFVPGLTAAAQTMTQAAEQQGALAAEIHKLRQSDNSKKLKPEAPAIYDGDAQVAKWGTPTNKTKELTPTPTTTQNTHQISSVR